MHCHQEWSCSDIWVKRNHNFLYLFIFIFHIPQNSYVVCQESQQIKTKKNNKLMDTAELLCGTPKINSSWVCNKLLLLMRIKILSQILVLLQNSTLWVSFADSETLRNHPTMELRFSREMFAGSNRMTIKATSKLPNRLV